jgi:hypothetical protein
MTTKEQAKALWLVGGLHPTRRKVRDGWGTRFVVVGGERNTLG